MREQHARGRHRIAIPNVPAGRARGSQHPMIVRRAHRRGAARTERRRERGHSSSVAQRPPRRAAVQLGLANANRRPDRASIGPANTRRIVGAPRCTIRPDFAPCWHLSVTAGWNDAPPRRRPGSRGATQGSRRAGTPLGTLPLGYFLSSSCWRSSRSSCFSWRISSRRSPSSPLSTFVLSRYTRFPCPGSGFLGAYPRSRLSRL